MFRFLILALCMLCGPALAQSQARIPDFPPAEIDPSTLSDADLLDLLAQLENQRSGRPSRVGVFGIPSGFGAPRGLGFVSVAATNRRDRNRLGDWDASLALGLGLGDADRFVSVTPVIDVTSVSGFHFGESGKINATISRNVSFTRKWRGAVGLDLQNLLTWGDSRVLDREWTVAVSALRPADQQFGVPVMLSVGYGSGVANRGIESGAFGGIGVGLSNSFGLSLGWFGDEAIAGANFWVLPQKNVQISLGVADITNRIDGRRAILAISFAKPVGGLIEWR